MSEPRAERAGTGHQEEEPIVSRKVFIGTLSALAFTTGLTIALIPAFKRNRLRASARQAGQALDAVSRKNKGVGLNSASGLGLERNAGPVAGKSEGVVQRLSGVDMHVGAGPSLSSSGALSNPAIRLDERTPSSVKSRRGPLDGLLGPALSTIASSSNGQRSSSASKTNSTKIPRQPGPLDGLLGGLERDAPLATDSTKGRNVAGGTPITLVTGEQARSKETAGVLSGLSVLPVAATVSSLQSPSTLKAPSDMTTSPTDVEPVAPTITYFSLTPADPYSDEEDAHGFSLDPNSDLHDNLGESEMGETGEGEEISPWFALKAFSIATALVLGGAGVIVVGIGKGLGVGDMDEFTAKMRSWTQKTLPDLQDQIFKPMVPDASSDGATHNVEDDSLDRGQIRIGFEPVSSISSPSSALVSTGRTRTAQDEEEESIVSGWWKGVVEGAEEERRGRRR